MAKTIGKVLSLVWSGALVCARIGQPGAAEQVFLAFDRTDSAATLEAKRRMVKLMLSAKNAGHPVSVDHADADAVIVGVTYAAFDICPSRAILNDFFTVSGTDLPDDTVLIFDGPATLIKVTPDLVRPDWVLVAQLPPSIPAGRQTVQLRSDSIGWWSDAVPIDVSSGAPEFVRRLYTGAPKDASYTIAFIACPAIRGSAGALRADPITSDRPAFHTQVAFAIDNLLRCSEDVLRSGGLDSHIQFVTVFDSTRPVTDGSALVQEDTINMVSPRRDLFKSLMGAYVVSADVSFAITGSATHTRSSAWGTTDDLDKPLVSYTYDALTRTHGRFASIPGTVALSVTADRITPLHEFGHAASNLDHGLIDDLYVDRLQPVFVVNKIARATSTDPVPAAFATYNATAFNSDLGRDSLGYPMTWTSYHCQLLDPARPNMMDDYTTVSDPRRCRLDRVTYAWLTDRLRAKIFR
jgi:hypothetical protein